MRTSRFALLALFTSLPTLAQHGATNGEWRFYGGDAGTAVAVDPVTGETLSVYRLDEGSRGNVVAREVNRGLAYWSDGKNDSRIILISPGISSSASTRRPAFL